MKTEIDLGERVGKQSVVPLSHARYARDELFVLSPNLEKDMVSFLAAEKWHHGTFHLYAALQIIYADRINESTVPSIYKDNEVGLLHIDIPFISPMKVPADLNAIVALAMSRNSSVRFSNAISESLEKSGHPFPIDYVSADIEKYFLLFYKDPEAFAAYIETEDNGDGDGNPPTNPNKKKKKKKYHGPRVKFRKPRKPKS